MSKLQDFIDREDDFVIGSDPILVNGSNSKFILGDKIEGGFDIIKNAYRIAKTRLSTMGIGRKVNLIFTKDDNCTNGKYIKVSTRVLDDTSLDSLERIDVLNGEVTHEGAHVLFTDFKTSFEAIGTSKLKKNIFNVIEDERIERLVVERFPGFRSNLVSIKKYIFDLLAKEIDYSQLSQYEQVYHLFFDLVRYPAKINESLLDEHVDFVSALKNILTPYPMTTNGALKAMNEVFDLLISYMSEEEKRKQEETDQTDEKGGDEQPKTIGELIDDLENSDLLKRLGELLASSIEEYSDKMVEVSEEVEANELPVRELQGEISITDCSIFTHPETAGNSEYMQIRKKVQRHAGPLANSLKLQTLDQNFTQQGMRNGHLDTSKLAEVKQGVENVYMNLKSVTKDHLAICLLIDESGSMGCNKIETAKEIAVLFNEAVKRIQSLELFIYGFTSNYAYSHVDSEQFIYKEPNVDFRNSVAFIDSKSENADHLSILECAKRVRSFTKSKCLFVVLSDGQPSAPCYRNTKVGIRETREAVEQIKTMGFFPMQIGIETRYIDNPMFEDWVQFNDLNTMVNEVSKIVIQKVGKLLTS